MKKITLFLLVLAFTATGVNAQIKTVAGTRITDAQLDSFLHVQMDSFKLPGLSIAVITNNRIVYHKTFGVKDIGTKEPVNDSTMFEAASLSKTVFAYFVMKLVEQGVLNLDTPLYRYMPYPDIKRDERYKLITARMALSHTTGMPNWRYINQADSSMHIKNGDLYLNFTPGTSFGYSGEGYQYLTQVVAHLTNHTITNLEDLFQQKVAQPLKLTHFYFTGNSFITHNKASGHVQGKSVGKPWPMAFPGGDSTIFLAAASLHTEAVDYAKFVIAMMQHKDISKVTLAEMLKPQVNIPETNELNKEGGYKAWGLGIAEVSTPYGTAYLHGGNNGDFQAGWFYLPANKSGYTFFTNCDKGNKFEKRLQQFLLSGN